MFSVDRRSAPKNRNRSRRPTGRRSVERTIGRLKEHTSLRENHARGLRKIETHVQLCIFCLLLAVYTVTMNNREDLAKSITRITQ